MVPIEQLLSSLLKVRKVGIGRWIACCPAHNDSKPSLAIRETDDGRVLLHCFAGCSANEIVSALGIEMADLFPEANRDHHKAVRRPFAATDVLKIVATEVTIAYIAASDLAKGVSLTSKDKERLLLAASRLHHACDIANGN